MKAVIQRVIDASVTVEGQEISRVGRGLAVLLGVQEGDTIKDVNFLAEKTNAEVCENVTDVRCWYRLPG